MRSIRTFILRLLESSTGPEALRGELRPVPEGEASGSATRWRCWPCRAGWSPRPRNLRLRARSVSATIQIRKGEKK